MCDPSTGSCAAHANAAAAASVAFEHARNTLRTACQSALDSGMPLEDLARATGRDPQHITALIGEATL